MTPENLQPNGHDDLLLRKKAPPNQQMSQRAQHSDAAEEIWPVTSGPTRLPGSGRPPLFRK